ncbi:MAG TPA: nuclear transport factor 2 family protein [Tepidisphaeraceae bacterium]|jgi:hypothetical protein|nr:nuclear transport factor 2 family protein [Tepidisphaeraceae bacterium]
MFVVPGGSTTTSYTAPRPSARSSTANKFIVEFEMDVTFKPTGKRTQMRETGLYTVAGGKVAREGFFYIEA